MLRFMVFLFLCFSACLPEKSSAAGRAVGPDIRQAARADSLGSAENPMVVRIISEPAPDSSSAWRSNFVLPVEVGVVIAILSYAISYAETFFRLGRGSRSLWSALAAEIRFCSDLADINIKDNLKSLSYRFPTSVYDNLFPKLLDNNAISREEISQLQKFYAAVKSSNRSLEIASEHVALSQTPLTDQEHAHLLKRLGRIASKDGEYSVPMQKILKSRDA